jgi:phosphatidylethanolamine/phosphatidyl-N-methylethanolamine N-methyltransferase
MVYFTPTHSRGRDDLRFLLRWLRRPRGLGAVVPSSQALAAALAGQIDMAAPGTVIELGAGTGNVTHGLLDAGVAPDDLVVVEREAQFCATLTARFPELRVVEGDVRDMKALLRVLGIRQVKAVVSSLPLLNFSKQDRRRVVSQVIRVLAPDGVFVQYTYGPASPLPGRICTELGIEGERNGWVLANLPPAAVWRYRRVRAAPPLTRAA